MKTSWDELREIERYQLNEMDAQEKESFECRLLLDTSFRDNFDLQQEVYKLLRFLHRKVLRREIRSVQEQLFQHPEHQAFQEKIQAIFNHKK